MEKGKDFTCKTSQVLNLFRFSKYAIISIIIIFLIAKEPIIISSILSFFSKLIGFEKISMVLIGLILILAVSLRALWFYFVVKNTYYVFEEEKIEFNSGVLNKSYEYIEFFRIKDYSVKRSLIERFLGLHTLVIHTTDRSHPYFKFSCISGFKDREKEFRNRIFTSQKNNFGGEVDIV